MSVQRILRDRNFLLSKENLKKQLQRLLVSFEIEWHKQNLPTEIVHVLDFKYFHPIIIFFPAIRTDLFQSMLICSKVHRFIPT